MWKGEVNATQTLLLSDIATIVGKLFDHVLLFLYVIIIKYYVNPLKLQSMDCPYWPQQSDCQLNEYENISHVHRYEHTLLHIYLETFNT